MNTYFVMQNKDQNVQTEQVKRYQVQEVANPGGASGEVGPGGAVNSPDFGGNFPPGTTPFVPKKRRPKIILILLAISVLAILAFMALRFRPSDSTLLGTPGEIVWWGIQHDEAIYKPLIEEYQRQHPNIKITYQKQSTEDYRERLTNAIAKGEGPDIFEIHNSWPYMFINDLAPLPAAVMSQEEYDQMFYPVITSALKIGGRAMAMPLEYDAITLYINEDIFTSSIKRPPVTWDDLAKLADSSQGGLTIRQRDGNRIIQSGVAMGYTSNVDYWPEILALLLYQNRVDPARANTASARQVVTFYRDFRDMGTWNNTLPSSTIAFSRGNVAMYFGPTRVASVINSENPGLKFRTTLLPQLPKNSPSDPDYSYATFWVHGVWERSRNKEAAWGFLKFLSERESLEELNRNIKETEGYARAYPRAEMNVQYRDDPILGSITSLAMSARSWYLADNTNDGATGINTQLSGAFGEVVEKGASTERLNLLVKSVQDILSKYTIPAR
jgi:multiple sugar transport system substrate-binding protein